MKLVGIIESKDYQFFDAQHTSLTRKLYRLGNVVNILYLLLCIVTSFVLDIPYWIVVGTGFYLIGRGFSYLYEYMRKRIVANCLDEDDYPNTGQVSYEIRADEIVCTAPTYNSMIPFTSILEVIKVDDRAFFSFSEHSAFLLPRKENILQGDLDSFIQEVRLRIGDTE